MANTNADALAKELLSYVSRAVEDSADASAFLSRKKDFLADRAPAADAANIAGDFFVYAAVHDGALAGEWLSILKGTLAFLSSCNRRNATEEDLRSLRDLLQTVPLSEDRVRRWFVQTFP